MTPWKIVGAVGAACLLLSGCGLLPHGTPPKAKIEPVRFGKAAPSGKLMLGAAGRGHVPVREWVTGCELLKDKEITALLPQANTIDQTPRRTTDYLAPGSRVSAPQGGCEYDFRLTTSQTVIDTDSIFVNINGIGSPARVKHQYRRLLAGSSLGSGAAQLKAGSAICLHPGKTSSYDQLICRRGPLLYSVSGSSLGDVPIPGVPTGSSQAVNDARATIWNQHVVIPAAATIAAKIA